MSADDNHYMQRCFELARKGEFNARPNPMVGCVVVGHENVIAEGWHENFGEAHAEVNALDIAGDKAVGACLYVSMEPCSHWGKTGPCVDRIIACGVSRVVFGMHDPNPLVSGSGIRKLKDSGIEVVGPVLEEEALCLNPGFIKRMQKQLPWVCCKLAMSLDGRTAMASGESKWITGPEARADVQLWRARSDAVMTGVETVIADDPGLDVRLEAMAVRQPLRIIVDSGLRTPPKAKIFQGPGEILLATAITSTELIEDKLQEYQDNKPQILSIPGDNGKVDLVALMSFLAKKAVCNQVMVESGSTLAGALLRAGLVDEVLTYVAPKLLGSDARPLFTLPGIDSMANHVSLQITDVEMLGKDCRMRSRVLK
ncbi:MAG: bifunctional diaminohydroxyphosphoribosylaminopyrimidine deaminase/5-amino-6-(5-phosphoribosylamino)uracil reductase RibD [Pseudohongiellaceae bacterium]